MNGYVTAGYGVTLVVLAGYALAVLRRGRQLRRRLDGRVGGERR